MRMQSSLTRLYDLLLVATVLSVSNAFVVPMPAIASKPPASSSTLFGGLRGVETFDGAFTLSPESEGVLVGYMECEDMKKEVCKQAKCTSARFTGQLFQPVPYSPGTPLGMPREFEDFHLNPSYAICNVPPTVMFKAKIFKPPRLCAVFTIEGLDPDEEKKILEKARARMDLQAQAAAHQPMEEKDDGSEEKRPVTVLKGSPKEENWNGVGKALHEVALGEKAGEEEDEAALDAMVV
ncbi:hypothetical protein NGA_0429201 [Nannochloropsis gaditana CCMP526]|uniref:Uncharacterized protein n=1 Tax=Nannochloropsis gaditana TaxID=72520 RepID=W7TX51_9STRA|nr:hypothetical protein NGA_0429201 [Nannochloropsis gaditana CCMP526]EKU22527.1 hypothetical protein NGA_0429201 [Nannochloropsis gaditana CCMP526]EWM25246.1 hypothetical protein Naga_100571g2 [Nannochloropsis gaditana]|eukprot:XP_005853831.1 hypothetical protein NGA_0429201 [Nannochloropsis gaditana CCMP526]